MSFGARLKERREAIGMSRSDLAQKLSVTVSAIGNYENDVSSPKEEILYKLFKVLNVEPNYLWQDEMAKHEDVFFASFPERKIIEKYRALNEHGKKMVEWVLNEEYEHSLMTTGNGKVVPFAAMGGGGVLTEEEAERFLYVKDDNDDDWEE